MPFTPPIPRNQDVAQSYVKGLHATFLSKLNRLNTPPPQAQRTQRDNLQGFNVAISCGMKLLDRTRTFEKYPLIPSEHLAALEACGAGGEPNELEESYNTSGFAHDGTPLTKETVLFAQTSDLDFFLTGSDIFLAHTSESPGLGRHPSTS